MVKPQDWHLNRKPGAAFLAEEGYGSPGSAKRLQPRSGGTEILQ